MAKNRTLSGDRKVTKNPAGAPPSIVNQKIDIRPFGRREQDIPSWRRALQSAESTIPRKLLLYDLYADVDLDGHVEAVTGKRRDAVTTAEWKFVDKEGKDIDAVNQVIDSIGFEEMLEEIVNSKFWGYSILEPTFFKSVDDSWEMEANLIPRLNYRPELGIVAYDYSSDDGINVRQGIYAKTIMEVGRPKNLGLFLKAAPYQVLKRGGLGDWALFVQVFGNPIVDATWDGFDEGQRIKLLEAISALGSGGAIVRPEGTNITLIESKSTANGQLQDSFLSFLNKEISKALLGSTETTESSQSSGYAQSKTHEGQDERKNESDITFARRILNSRFVQILNAHGFDTKGGKFIVQGEDNELTVNESFEMHRKMATELNLPIDDDFWYDTYGVPKPDNYEQIKKEREESWKTEESRKTEDRRPKKDPPSLRGGTTKQSPNDREKLSLLQKLVSFFPQAPVPQKSGAGAMMTCCGDHPIKLALKSEPDYELLTSAVKKADGKVFIYPELVYLTLEPLLEAFGKGWEGKELIKLMDMGIEYGTTDPKIATAWEMNLFRFSTVKAAYQSAEVNALFRKAKDFREFERMVRDQYGVQSKQWLETEYNSAFQTGQAAATYYRLKGQMDTFKYWKYLTIGDDRVRNSHRILHGRILPADHPLWKKIFPPNGWGCRCYIVGRMAYQVDEEEVKADIAMVENYVTTDPEFVKSRKQGFGINRADIQEVFTDSQSYSKTPDKVLRKAGELGAPHWDMKPASEIKPDIEPSESTREALDQLWERTRDTGLQDYRTRPIRLDKTAVDKAYTDGSYRFTGELLDILSNPDEVWVNNQEANAFDSFVYIRYYKSEIIRVVASLDDTGNLRIVSWGSIARDPEESRRGLIVKR